MGWRPFIINKEEAKMANKKVKFLVNTAFRGPRKEGEVVSVPEDFANRWVKNGIAELVSGEEEFVEDIASTEVTEQVEDVKVKVEELTQEQETEQETEQEVDYASMSAKDLYALCKERGLDVEAKKSKEYYIEKLS